MKTDETRAIWRYRFIDRTHDLELLKVGKDADIELYDRVYLREWHKHKDHERAENTAKINLIWRGFEELCDSLMLAKYN
jgi:hypothetical protein